MDINFLAKKLDIPIIDSDRNYWLVRSNQGSFYEDYYVNNFIALGYNEITEQDVKTSQKPEITKSYLKDKVLSTLNPKKYQNERSLKRAANIIARYIKTFCIDIKKGDIVIIPSRDSAQLTFAEITDNQIHYLNDEQIKKHKESNEDSDLIKINCDYKKRRNITILKTIYRKDADLKLSQAFFGANTIANLDKYSLAIDRTLCDLYVKNNKLYYKFSITTKENITASNYLNIMYALKTACEECESHTGIDCDFDSLSIKAQAESPGFWQMVFENANIIIPCLGILGICLAGGKIKISSKKENPTEIELESEGILEKSFKFYKEHNRHIEEKTKILETIKQLRPPTDDIKK